MIRFMHYTHLLIAISYSFSILFDGTTGDRVVTVIRVSD